MLSYARVSLQSGFLNKKKNRTKMNFGTDLICKFLWFHDSGICNVFLFLWLHYLQDGVLSLICVALLWGVTNPLMGKGSSGIQKVQHPNFLVRFGSELKFLLSNWKVSPHFLHAKDNVIAVGFTIVGRQLIVRLQPDKFNQNNWPVSFPPKNKQDCIIWKWSVKWTAL